MKLLYLDVETTGLACPSAGLIQVAGAIEVDGALVEEFDFRARPFPGDAVSDEALAVNGVSREQLASYPPPETVHQEVLRFLGRYVDRFDRRDKLHVVAYNARFDVEHLRSWFEKNDDRYYGSWFWHPPLDVMTMAAAALANRRAELPDFRLTTVCGVLGMAVDEEKVHDALYDVRLTRKLFGLLRGATLGPIVRADGVAPAGPSGPGRGPPGPKNS